MSLDFTQQRIARILADRYQILDFLGSGGFAQVYRAVNRTLGRVEALKVLTRGVSDDPDFARRFEQEARICAALDHPHIVKIFDYGHVENVFYFSMQFVDGPTVAEKLREHGPIPEEESGSIALAVLDALAYSHRRDVIHRDIKPDNVILDSTGRPFLMDFGVAKTRDSAVQTQVGTVLGSPAYLSPEQILGDTLDGRSDLYSLGATLYKMISGSAPFVDPDVMTMVTRRLREEPPALSEKCPGVSAEFSGIVTRALARRPDDRYPTATAMHEAIDDFLFVRRLAHEEKRRSRARQETGATAALPVTAIPEPLVAPPEPMTLPVPAAAAPAVAPAPVSRPVAGRRVGLVAAIAIGTTGIAGLLVVRPWAHSEPPRSRPRASLSAPAPPAAQPPSGSVSSVTAAPPASAPVELPATKAPVPAPAIRAAPSVRREPSRIEPAPAAPPRRVAVTMPELLDTLSPDFPEGCRQSRVTGSVGITALVGEDGRVESARVISSLRPDCDRAVLEAVRRARFKPALGADGSPVSTRVALPVEVRFGD